MKAHYLQPQVGHYGVFNGSRFRAEIAPRIADFALTHNGPRQGTKEAAKEAAKDKGAVKNGAKLKVVAGNRR
jgi:poly(3-hydroxybutyrate) depolymerase